MNEWPAQILVPCDACMGMVYQGRCSNDPGCGVLRALSSPRNLRWISMQYEQLDDVDAAIARGILSMQGGPYR